jgi:hypothetical protein
MRESTVILAFLVGHVIGVLAGLHVRQKNPQSPRAWCEDTCLVLDMEYASSSRCVCVCKDVDGSYHHETIPDCP